MTADSFRELTARLKGQAQVEQAPREAPAPVNGHCRANGHGTMAASDEADQTWQAMPEAPVESPEFAEPAELPPESGHDAGAYETQEDIEAGAMTAVEETEVAAEARIAEADAIIALPADPTLAELEAAYAQSQGHGETAADWQDMSDDQPAMVTDTEAAIASGTEFEAYQDAQVEAQESFLEAAFSAPQTVASDEPADVEPPFGEPAADENPGAVLAAEDDATHEVAEGLMEAADAPMVAEDFATVEPYVAPAATMDVDAVAAGNVAPVEDWTLPETGVDNMMAAVEEQVAAEEVRPIAADVEDAAAAPVTDAVAEFEESIAPEEAAPFAAEVEDEAAAPVTEAVAAFEEEAAPEEAAPFAADVEDNTTAPVTEAVAAVEEQVAPEEVEPFATDVEDEAAAPDMHFLAAFAAEDVTAASGETGNEAVGPVAGAEPADQADALQPEDLSMPVDMPADSEPQAVSGEAAVPEADLVPVDPGALNDIIGTLAAKFTNSQVIKTQAGDDDEFGHFEPHEGDLDRAEAGEGAPVAVDPQSAATAKLLLDIMSMPSGAAQPQERALAADTLLRLVDRMPSAALVGLAERLCIMETPPTLLVNKLIAHRNSEVAGPLLERCTLISDQDLLRIVRNSDNVKRRIVARRRSISSALCDALIAHGDSSVALTVVRNPGAELSYQAFIRLVESAKSQPTLQAPLSTRADTPAPVAFELFWCLPSELRRYVLSRFLTDSTTLDKILQIARTVDAEDTETQQDKPKFADKELVAQFINLVDEGRTPEAARLLATMAGICEANAMRVITDPEGEPISVACKAIGVTRAQFSEAIARWEKSSNAMLRTDKNITELKNLFESLSFNKARTLLTYWDWAAQKSGPYARKVA